MLFNSAPFAIFFPIVVALFFLLPKRFQWIVLLLSSAYFYMAFVPWYILVLIFLIIVDYVMAIAIDGASNGHKRKVFLIVSIISNLGILFVFKYFNFFNENAAELARWIGWNYSIEVLQIILPLGLSFHVFQSLSYVIEVYRGKQSAERHLGIYALYVLFFPQLVAGPIERPQQLLPQLHLEQSFDLERTKDGLTLILWGFFKKLVVADQLAIVVDQIYGDLYGAPPAAILIAVTLFAYQLYCDFSGYSDIALGSSRVLGFELVKNFDRPYATGTISEFWRRWHISLSSWLRDYLFFPLAVSWRRWGRLGSYLATVVTFILIGLWHGAAWTFVMLGLTHGIYLVAGEITAHWRDKFAIRIGFDRVPRLRALWKITFVFALVSLSWVFFRALSLGDAWHIISSVPAGIVQFFDMSVMRAEVLTRATLGVSAPFLLLRIISVGFMELIEFLVNRHGTIRGMLLGWSYTQRTAAYAFVLLWIFVFGNFGAESFIYFQF